MKNNHVEFSLYEKCLIGGIILVVTLTLFTVALLFSLGILAWFDAFRNLFFGTEKFIFWNLMLANNYDNMFIAAIGMATLLSIPLFFIIYFIYRYNKIKDKSRCHRCNQKIDILNPVKLCMNCEKDILEQREKRNELYEYTLKNYKSELYVGFIVKKSSRKKLELLKEKDKFNKKLISLNKYF